MGFLFGAFAAILILFYVLGRLMDARQMGALKQYEFLAKRFGLDARRFGSKWGKGIGERLSLEGWVRGYPVRLYDHYLEENGKRQKWTSLTLELLFTGGLEMIIDSPGSQPEARFEVDDRLELRDNAWPHLGAASCYVNDPDWMPPSTEKSADERLERLLSRSPVGAIRLSKGFLEYRESGSLNDDQMRIRFQDALLALASIADALSVHPRRERWERLLDE